MSTATEMVRALEAEMARAFAAGDDGAFTVARNRREAYSRFREGSLTLEQARYALAKMPKGSRAKAPAVLLEWDGLVEPVTGGL